MTDPQTIAGQIAESKVAAYVFNGGDELLRAQASEEYALGHLGSLLKENEEQRAEIATLSAALKEAEVALEIALVNGTIVPDPRMENMTDLFGIPFDDRDTLASALTTIRTLTAKSEEKNT